MTNIPIIEEKGGEQMRKILKMVAIASALVIILVVSVVSTAMAAGPNPAPGSGTCPNPDCTGVCPNPDCTWDGDQLQYQHQNGLQDPKGSAFKYQHRFGQID
jgi:hypothetical protein